MEIHIIMWMSQKYHIFATNMTIIAINHINIHPSQFLSHSFHTLVHFRGLYKSTRNPYDFFVVVWVFLVQEKCTKGMKWFAARNALQITNREIITRTLCSPTNLRDGEQSAMNAVKGFLFPIIIFYCWCFARASLAILQIYLTQFVPMNFPLFPFVLFFFPGVILFNVLTDGLKVNVHPMD